MLCSVDRRSRNELTGQWDWKQCPDIAIDDYRDGKNFLLDIAVRHPWVYLTICCQLMGKGHGRGTVWESSLIAPATLDWRPDKVGNKWGWRVAIQLQQYSANLISAFVGNGCADPIESWAFCLMLWHRFNRDFGVYVYRVSPGMVGELRAGSAWSVAHGRSSLSQLCTVALGMKENQDWCVLLHHYCITVWCTAV